MAIPFLPRELLNLVVASLSASHSCRTCFQADVRSLALVSRELNAVVTPWLYSSICLRAHGDGSTYEQRVQHLVRTLSSQPYLASLVKSLRFAHEQEATAGLWKDVVSLTPNLEKLQGVDTFFREVDDETEEEAEVLRTENFAALETLRGLRNLKQAVVHQEVLTCALSTLLSSWPSLEALVLGDCIPASDPDNYDAECSFTDVAEFLAATPSKLRNLYLYDCELDVNDPSDPAKLLASLPPLERLGVEYCTRVSLRGITGFLNTSRKHAETLHTLDFHRQARRTNSLDDIIDLLSAAKGLKSLSLTLSRSASDKPDEQSGRLLASSTLEELRWVPTYSADETDGDDTFTHVLERSLRAKSMPKLRLLTIGHDVSGPQTESAEAVEFSIYKRLDKLVEEEVLQMGGNGTDGMAGVPRLVLDIPEPGAAGEKREDVVRGFKCGVQKRGRCEAVEEEEEAVVVGKEELWRDAGNGDLRGLWVGSAH